MSRERGPVEKMGNPTEVGISLEDAEMQSGWIQAPRKQWDAPQKMVTAGIEGNPRNSHHVIVGERKGEEWEVIAPRVTRFNVLQLADGTLGIQPHKKSSSIHWNDLPKIPGTPSEFVNREDLEEAGMDLPRQLANAKKKGASHLLMKSGFQPELRPKK